MSTEIEKDERAALEIFRDRIPPEIYFELNEYKRHDLWMLRWLRARENNIDKALDMLVKSFEWRREDNIDEILTWKVPDIFEEFPLKAPGSDKDGAVVAIVPFGKWDTRKVVGLGMKKDLIRYVDQIFEMAMRFLEYKSRPAEGKMLTQFTIILDFEGFSLRQLASTDTIQTIMEIISRFEKNHPETLKAGYVINAPKIFEILFSLIKPFLTARTLAKVFVFGSNSDEWRPAVLQNIEPDQLCSAYGGANTTCKNYKVIHGFDIFPVYDVYPESEMISIIVEAGAKHPVQFYLSRGSKLSWNFRSIDYDVGFSVLCELDEPEERNGNEEAEEELEEKATVLFSCPRADAHLHLQKGAIQAEKSGHYSIVFDNSFSRFRSKTIFYAVRIKSEF